METFETFFLWGISFCSLFFSVFWIVLLKTKEKELLKVPELKKYPFISFIIPTRNGAKTIPRLVDSILATGYPRDKYEIIVALNNCTDNTEQIVRTLKKKIRNIRLADIDIPKGRRGKAYAFNKALDLAKGNIVACLDDDSIIAKDALQYMIPMMEDKKVAAVIPACKVWQPKNLLEKCQVMEYALSSFARKLLTFVGALYVIPGALSLFKKDALIKVGRLDEYTLTEDFEIAVRLVKHGYLVESQIRSTCYTEVPNNLPDFHRQRVRWARGFITTVFKHKDMLLNPKYGVLGAFLLPFIVILATFALFVTGLIIYGLVKGAIFLAANWQYLSLESLKISIFDFNPLVTIIIVLLILGLYFLYKGYNYLGYRWQYPIAMLVYFTYYQPLLASYWLFGFLYEIFKAKKAWYT